MTGRPKRSRRTLVRSKTPLPEHAYHPPILRAVVLPLLLFPVVLPPLLAAIATTTSTMRGETYGSSGWFILMLAFDVIFVTIGITTYEYVISE